MLVVPECCVTCASVSLSCNPSRARLAWDSAPGTGSFLPATGLEQRGRSPLFLRLIRTPRTDPELPLSRGLRSVRLGGM